MKTIPTKVFLIEKYYDILGSKLEWDRDKILRLCRTVKITLEELQALLRMDAEEFNDALDNPSKQVCLLIYQIAVTRGYFPPHPLPKQDDRL